MKSQKVVKRLRIRRGIRKKIQGSAERPRLSVFKSNRNIYVQLIDDVSSCTLACSSSQQVGAKDKNNCSVAEKVGKQIGELAVKKNIKQVVFDRNGWPYHGKLKALAEAVRREGLIF